MIDFDCFKFQSDSINTMAGVDLIVMLVTFKFQSDSINTAIDKIKGVFKFSL